MPMESILKKLEARIEEFVRAHQAATARVAELEGRVSELEARLEQEGEAAAKLHDLEEQREDLAGRLGKVLAAIDSALAEGPSETS